MADSTPWRLTWGPNSWTEADITGQHAALLCLIYKAESWAVLAKNPLDDPIALQAYLAVFRAVAEGRDCLEMQVEIATLPAVRLLDCVGFDVAGLPAPTGAPANLPAP